MPAATRPPTNWKLPVAMVVAAAALLLIAWGLPGVRREFVRDITKWDAPPSAPTPLAAGSGTGLPAVARTRVILVDGLSQAVAATLPQHQALCARGMKLRVDVGFPTVSLPVETELWSGLMQQQTGTMYRSDRPIVPPFDRRGIPAQVPGSIAIAENHGYIVRSLGFATALPAADPAKPAKDADPKVWDTQWEQTSLEAIASDARLVFVHILRVDVVGHKQGSASEAYAKAAAEADAIVGKLVAADDRARWFLLSDHGHLPTGGHGGEERAIRQVQACIAGPGIAAEARDDRTIHLVDIARAIADSTEAKLDPASLARPLAAALAQPLEGDQAVPPLALGNGAGAIFCIVAGLAALAWAVRRWWLAPWWFVAGVICLFAIRGIPTLSTPFVYKPEGRDMYMTWAPTLLVAAVTTWIGLGKESLQRVLVSQLALPFAAVLALVTASGAWPTLFGAEVAPVVPRYTAWIMPALLIAGHGAAVVALAVLARLVRLRSVRSSPPEPPRSEPAVALSDPAGVAPDPPA